MELDLPIDAQAQRSKRWTPKMEDMRKTKRELVDELVLLRRRLAQMQEAELELQTVAKALRQSEMQFRKITEKSIVGVYLIQDMVFKYVNPKMAEIVGYTVEQLVDKKGPEDVVADEDWPLVRENLRKRVAGEMESINYSFMGKKGTGEIVHLEVYGSRMEYQGRPAVIGTILDVTQRVRAERELETQLKRFQTLYHLAVTMTAEHSLAENLRILVETSLELLEADTAFIAVRDEKAGTLHVCACAGMDSQILLGLDLLQMPRNAALTGPLRKPCRLEENFEELKGAWEHQLCVQGLSSGIAVPVRVKETELGVLCAGSRIERSFADSQKDLLSLVGNMAALEINRKQAEEALAQSEDQLRLLSRQLLKVQEDDRKRVAQDLHDGIGQSVTAMKFKVENVIRRASESVPKKHLAPLKSLIPMIQEVVEEVGRIAMDLRPSILDDLGILATLAWLCREFGRTHPHIKVKKNFELEESQIPEHQKIVIFRILQEALNNVAKHSQAKSVYISLRRQDGVNELMIHDDGVGFDWDSVRSAESRSRGFGLASMKERTQLSGGSFTVKTRRGAGTMIAACWGDR